MGGFESMGAALVSLTLGESVGCDNTNKHLDIFGAGSAHIVTDVHSLHRLLMCELSVSWRI